MAYQVPQFIDIEDKIVGPLTMKQFIYIAGASGACVVFFVYLPTLLAFLLAIPVVALAATLSFYKVNGKTFIEMLEAGFNYYTGAKLFLWKHQDRTPGIAEAQAAAAAAAATSEATTISRPHQRTPKLTRDRLSELSWSLDIRNSGSAGHSSQK